MLELRSGLCHCVYIHSYIQTNTNAIHQTAKAKYHHRLSNEYATIECMLFHTAHTHTFSSFLLCRISYNKTICLPLWWDALAGDKLCWTTPASVRFMNCVKRIFNCRAQKHFLLQRSHKMRWIFGSGIFPFGTVRK